MLKNRKILFLYPDISGPMLKEISSGYLPKERLYGLVELRNQGWETQISDARWIGLLAELRRNFRQFIEIPSINTLLEMRKSDIVLVKDNFSIALLLQAKILGKRIVYLDAMFDLPKRFWRKWSIAINLRFADAVLCYSNFQANKWIEAFDLPNSCISVLPYCMDVNFYPKLTRCIEDPPFIVAVGRDLGRDYSTLIKAAIRLGVNVKIITLPYLLPDNIKNNPQIHVLEKITYPELFSLYSRAIAAVVPLKRGICYPSGIRAVLESMLLGVPTIATATPILEEYLGNDKHVLFVDAEDIDKLTNQITWVLDNRIAAEKIAAKASERVRQNFHMGRFINELENRLEKLS